MRMGGAPEAGQAKKIPAVKQGYTNQIPSQKLFFSFELTYEKEWPLVFAALSFFGDAV